MALPFLPSMTYVQGLTHVNVLHLPTNSSSFQCFLRRFPSLPSVKNVDSALVSLVLREGATSLFDRPVAQRFEGGAVPLRRTSDDWPSHQRRIPSDPPGIEKSHGGSLSPLPLNVNEARTRRPGVRRGLEHECRILSLRRALEQRDPGWPRKPWRSSPIDQTLAMRRLLTQGDEDSEARTHAVAWHV